MSAWREFAARLRGFFGRAPREEDLAEELQFHRDMLAADHRRRGLDAESARRTARLDLGGDAQVIESWRDQRSLPALDLLRQDLRYGLRMLRNAPGFTAAAIVTLALGIGANTAIFSVVDAILLRPLPYADPGRLVVVGDRNPDGSSTSIGFTTVADWRARSRTFERFGLMRSWQPTLVTNGEAERLPAVRVSWDYFDVLGVRPVLGRPFVEDDDRPGHANVVLLSDGLWHRRFGGDPGIVGRTLVMNDRPYRVVGVMPATFEPLESARYYAPAQLWAPIGYDLQFRDACRSCRHLRAFGRLKSGVTLAQATAEMDAIREQMRQEHPSDYEPGRIAVVPLHQAITGDVRAPLLVLLGAVGFVLLVACANVANLLLARALSRERELVLRSVLGAGRARIIRQLLTESALLSVLGATVGVALASVAVRGLAVLAPVSLPRLESVTIDARVLAFTAAVALLTSVIFGLVPAWRGATAGLQRSMAIDSRGSVGGRTRARAALVVLDLVVALVLLAGAGLMIRTVAALTHADAGFDPDRVLSLHFSLVGKAYAEDPAVLAFQNRFLEKARGLPGVETVALAGQIPFGGDFDCWGFHAKDRMNANESEDPCIQRYGVSPDYLRVMGIRLLSGRFFTEADLTAAQPVIVISESTARQVWGPANPIGSEVRIGGATKGAWRTVIGIVADTHHEDLTAPPTAAMYVPQTQVTDSYLVAVIKSSSASPGSLAAAARGILRELDPTVPVHDVAALGALLEKSAAQRRFVMRLLGGFAMIAVLLAAVGLYGVVAHGVSQRTREVGVRIAIGAQRSDIVRLVLGGGATVMVAGVAGGVAAALLTTRFLGALVFGVRPQDPVTLGVAALLLTLVAVAAHLVPIRRALRIDPAAALRHE